MALARQRERSGGHSLFPRPFGSDTTSKRKDVALCNRAREMEAVKLLWIPLDRLLHTESMDAWDREDQVLKRLGRGPPQMFRFDGVR